MSGSITDDDFYELVRRIYEAASEPHLWSHFLEAYVTLSNCQAASFVVHDFGNQRANLAVSVGIDPQWQKHYEEYYAGINEWTLRKPHLFVPGAVLHGEQAISTEDLVKTEYYSDFLRPNDWLYSYGAVMSRDENLASYISTLRSPETGPFTGGDAEILPRLMPHLQCSLRIHQRIAGMEAALMAASDALDRLPVGVIVVDEECRPLLVNRAAEGTLSVSDGLILAAKRVSAASPAQNRQLRERVTVAAGSAGIRSGAVLRISRRSGKRDLELMITPLPRSSSLSSGRPAAVLFVADPEHPNRPDAEVFQQIYGLTAAEARMAAALMQGQTVEQYAQETALSLNTVRTHLKRIFSKTRTSRQGELMRLFLNSVAKLRK